MIPPLPGCDSQAIVSATSTGSPPCCSELSRDPTSRVPSGIFAVISVTMKPGATALMVAFRSANAGAHARTMPITPAFDAA